MFPVKLLSACAFFFLAVSLWSRDVVISAEDADLGYPLDGAVVLSWDGTKYVCDGNGNVTISVPDDRQVFIQLSYPGYQTGRFAIVPGKDSFLLALRLGGAVESKDVVIEARRPGSGETRPGRSVAISGEQLDRGSRIGIIEDVMTAIKLLPGVGYTGMFNAMPSIRGGDPGDLMAALDGFYIENPYHWGGGFSIFDPHMIESAQLSHGVFSSRYGHTISGLLELQSKKANPDQAELELGVSSSAVNVNVSLPLEKGGVIMMGKVTYWDPFVWAAQALSKVVDNEQLRMVNAVSKAPYIRSGTVSANYRFTPDLEWTGTLFAGSDGVGADYKNESKGVPVSVKNRMFFDWDNFQAFLVTGLAYNPRPSMLLKTTLGAGFSRAAADARILYDYFRFDNGIRNYELGGDTLNTLYTASVISTNAQGRVDFDWSLNDSFLFAAGIQELYAFNTSSQEGKFFREEPRIGPYGSHIPPGQIYYVHRPVYGTLDDARNQRVNSSAYSLLEYTSPEGTFGAELGLRIDHLYFIGKDFTIQTAPALNPRLNLDYTIVKDWGILDSLGITAGTGLFSSVNDAISAITPGSGITDFTLKPNRSWTSIVGVQTGFTGGWSLNIEGYFKYVFDQAYQYQYSRPGQPVETVYRFNGEGAIWGFDLMLQKFESRYWDGWLSYTFTHARYHRPEQPVRGATASNTTELEDSGWYYPSFHRFHNVNLVVNFKPSKKWNIYTRLGLASGMPKPEVGAVTPYPVLILKEDGTPLLDSLNNEVFVTKYHRESNYSDSSRTTWSIPLDVKLSYYMSNPANKVQTEFYIAAENLLSLIYTAKANTSFNTYTGQEETGSNSARYELPIPMVSLGIKWSF